MANYNLDNIKIFGNYIKMIKCSNCGFKNSDDDIYCVRCAKKLSDNNDVNDKTVQLNELYYSFLINEMKNKNNETKPSQQIHDTNKIQQQIKQHNQIQQLPH